MDIEQKLTQCLFTVWMEEDLRSFCAWYRLRDKSFRREFFGDTLSRREGSIFMAQKKTVLSVQTLTRMALLVAIAVVFSYIPGITLIPAVNFIHYELSDLPILIGALAFGAFPGLAIAVVSVLLSFALGAEEGGFYGAVMHAIAIGAFAFTAGLIYHWKKTALSAILGLAAGIIAMTAIMIPANLLVTPIYTGATVQQVEALILPAILPVNLLKGAISAVLAFLIFFNKYIERILRGPAEK